MPKPDSRETFDPYIQYLSNYFYFTFGPNEPATSNGFHDVHWTLDGRPHSLQFASIENKFFSINLEKSKEEAQICCEVSEIGRKII